ncbi:LacI family DNA-binding transcriptional regulator [Pseudalkalibacillus hwajinpoensis]|uniref:LacI family transcriptional regulator n=1 Tax=Guptibacillus hwajinpoensis TaxID=208199 RepID=A0A4U1MJH0_9BACL|nr:LacI family DNA-binding transcriptional regulator [Pseudalkalibacillus hwajinpoensis]TKD70871.1 LacI family transcriptional regulator [Pseudalkalibacillus hwajinpoensis]
MATIKDVAKRAGVAVSTASYALNNIKKVSPATVKKVQDAARELNYQKNGFASDLKRTKTNTIALILKDLSGPYYSELIKGVQEVTMTNGFDLIACSSIGGSQSTAVKFLKEKRVDGAIILAHNITDEIIHESAREGFPIVVLDRNLNNDHIIQVEVDNTQGGYIATEHLIQNGHQEIAYISGPYDSHDNEMRFNGFQQALSANELRFQSRWKISGDFTREGGYRATKMLIAQGNLPTAAFYANDEMALGGIQAFRENNISIPEDISVIGFDDIQLSEYVSPPLTTIKQPKYEAGALAVHLIFQQLSLEKVDRYYKLPTELVERKSVRTRRINKETERPIN